MKCAIIVFCVLIAGSLHAQDSIPLLNFSGYADVYYGYDFGKPANGLRPGFLYNHSQHNRFNVNLVFLKFAYAKNRLRFNMAPMLGTYSQSNLNNEPFYLRQVFELNIGGKVLKKKDLWLDAGVLPSHIGFESAISKDCATLSRSILAENTPYFETGIKLTYKHKERFTFAALVLTGWQRIKPVAGNSLPAFGTQFSYQPNSKLLFNHSTFIGSDYEDKNRRMRYFQNMYVVYSPVSTVTLNIGFDIGVEQTSKRSMTYNVWYSGVVITRYQPVEHFAIAARYEYYSDKNGVMIKSNLPFQTHGVSLNCDYIISSKVLWRVEGRLLKSAEEVFTCNERPCSSSYSLLFSFAIILAK